MIKCSFCGTEFDENDSVKACAGCPMSKACNKLKCPNCGYEALKEPKLIRLIKGLFSSKRDVQCSSENKKKNLSQMKSGDTGIIQSIMTNDSSILKKLMCMGILPGASLSLLQTFPAYVVQVGFTHVAIDKDIASVIIVET